METSPRLQEAHQLLKTIFGYDTFLPLQEDIIASVLSHRDSIVIMPTGGGKSLCYQIPALISPGLTVVVSPLISLMKDQVEQLQELGVPAAFLNSSVPPEVYINTMNRVRSGEVKLLYVAPETLLTPRLFGLLDQVQVDCVAIDEAHCISEWGHDFRPEYRQLVDTRRRFPHAVWMALTATATPRVQDDIRKNLKMKQPAEFIASFNRQNLFLEVTPKVDAAAQTVEFIRRFPDQSGIIYCFSRKQVDDLSAYLEREGFSVRPYHAGLDDADRKQNQELFIRDDVQIIVATIAFGMGINKPNVRFVVHYDLPKSIEHYYQEIGRAGRDGLSAHCLLLYSYGDIQKIKYFINQKAGQEREAANLHLEALIGYAETQACRRSPLLAHFGETYTQANCDTCDNCRSAGSRKLEATIPAQKFISCIKRTGERFGLNHIIDVLLGSQNQKVRKFNHDQLSTYGIGGELSRDQWFRLGRQLIQDGYLEQDAQYGGLRFSPQTMALLKPDASYFAVLDDPIPAYLPERAAPQHDRRLFEALRAHRKALSDEMGVPPYVIFPDKTLLEMATYFPDSLKGLEQIFGVGQAKLAKYGEGFLAVIAAHAAEHGLQPPRKGTGKPSASSKTPGKLKHILVGEAYNAGASISELAEQHQVKQDTILNHLSKFVLEGNSLRPDDLLTLSALPEDQRQTVLDAFAAHGAEFLKPVFEALGGTVSYDELKILRLCYLSQSPSPR